MGYTDVAVTKAQLEFNAVTAGTTTNSKSLVTNSSGYMDKVTAVELQLNDTNNSDTLALWWNEDDSSDRTLAFKVNGGNATLDLIAGGTNAFTGDVTVAATGKYYMAADTYWSESAADVSSHFVGGVEALTIKEATNIVVGIQTENLATWTSTVSALQVGGTAGLSSETTQADGTKTWVSANAYHSSSTDTWKYISTNASDEANSIMFSDGAVRFRTAIAGVADAGISWINQLVLQNNSGSLSATFSGDIIVPQGNKIHLDSGQERISSNGSAMLFDVAGGTAFTMSVSGFQGNLTDSGSLQKETSSATNPVHSFTNNNTYGLGGLPSSNYVSMIANSGEGQRWVQDSWGVSSHFPEITTPTAIASYWSIYGKADNLLYFQDGAGTEHVVPTSDYAGIGMDTSTGFTIDLVDLFHKFELFDHDMPERVSNGVFGSNHIVLGATADYKILINSSFSAAAASKEFVGRVYCIGAALGGEIAGITGATPGVVSTDSAHGLSNGNKVKLTSNAMVEAMDKLFIVANVTATTFELTDDEGVNVATGGYTGADTNGTVHLATETSAHWHRNSSGTAIGNVSGHDIFSATISETLEYYIKNKTDANNATFDTTNMSIERL